MKTPLIHKIEVNYFRSIYHDALDECRPLNLIIGGNDSGKSNFLRAVNLFFNNSSDLGTPYNFERDLNIYRLQRATDRKKRVFLSVKVTFNNVFDYSSLPNRFTIKRQWNRYESTPFTELPSELIKKQNQVQRFLNKIQVHYVPAIKGRDIFKHYLGLLHDTLAAKNVHFYTATTQLTDAVNKATETMSSQIMDGIGIESSIAAPKDFRDLFGDLDFSTKIEKGESLSLKQRGDGVQVSHIPYILDYIAKESSEKFFVWLYEEPENSLEMKKSFELAEAFLKNFSQKNQIFLTTHSPAFYSLVGQSVSKWQVYKEDIEEKEETFPASKIRKINDLHDVDDGLGITALVADRAKELFDANREFRKKLDELKLLTKPMVLCEGKTDVVYIKKAIELCRKKSLLSKCEIVEVNQDGNGSGCTELKKVLSDRKRRPALYSSAALFVFDCDVPDIRENGDGFSVYQFPKQNNEHFSVGIENALDKDVSKMIAEDKKYWNVSEKNQGHKQVTIKELNKKRACDFVCERNQADDFQSFSGLIAKIEELTNGH